MAIPQVDTAVTVAAALRPRLDWAESEPGIIVADRRHPKSGGGPKNLRVRVERLPGPPVRYVHTTLLRANVT